MLPVDGDRLKEWLEEVALPKVSDADPAALSEYIVLLLDSIDLTYLDQSAKQQCVGKLHEFFETHTESFVDELFIYVAKHRQPAATPQPPPSDAPRHSASSASASHRDSRRRRSRNRSRSRSPSVSTSRSRSRSPDRDRDRRRRRSRDEQDDDHEHKRRGRDGRDDRGSGGRSSRGNELVRDYRFSGPGGEGGRERDRSADVRDRRPVERRDYRTDASSDGWQPVHHVVMGRRSRPSPSPPLVIQRPYVPPPERHTEEHVRQPRRTVLMPASNPFNTSAPPTTNATTASDSKPAADTVRVGQHTIVKRKRVDTADNENGSSARSYPAAHHSGAAATLLLSNAPRFALNIKLLMEHFSQFGAILGIDIQEAAGTATVKYGTAEDVLRALTAPPLHPQARLTVLPAQQLQPSSNSNRHVTEEQLERAQGEDGDEENDKQPDAHSQPNGSIQPLIAQPHASAPAATLSVGKHTITLKPKATPSPPPAQPLQNVEPAVPSEPPVVGSALHTAQLIRQQKQAQQQHHAQPNLATAQQQTLQQQKSVPTPSTPAATLPSPSPPASVPPPSAALSAAEKEHRTAVTKLQLLQAQIEQQERLMQRLEVAMAAQVPDSIEYNSLYAKRLDMDLTIEETRRQWREARGKVVMLTIKAGNAPAAGPSTAAPTVGSQSRAGSASATAMAM